MLALTQCWYTRKHVPERTKHKEDDGSHTSYCRYCERKIVSWSKDSWSLADGFNVSRIAETAGPRYLYLLDVPDDMVVARFTVSHLDGEEAIEAYKEELREEHNVEESGGKYILCDSADDT
ncbi:MAG: hypothetical protein H6917_17045 [Novosphingobium sp.]|nr:hypothetical protein [Novosphingobium sp.]MCP5404080.1 hypothetical protein [Novosphingobium sp.]